MSKYTIPIIAGLIAAVLCLGYFNYKSAQRNGELAQQLETAKAEADKWQDMFNLQQRDLAAASQRLDAALQVVNAAQQKAGTESKLFRTEIDNLKRTNKEYEKVLNTRIDDKLLIWLCQRNYANASVCKAVQQTTGNADSGLPKRTANRCNIRRCAYVGAGTGSTERSLQRKTSASPRGIKKTV